jgi:hypothetical protein
MRLFQLKVDALTLGDDEKMRMLGTNTPVVKRESGAPIHQVACAELRARQLHGFRSGNGIQTPHIDQIRDLVYVSGALRSLN